MKLRLDRIHKSNDFTIGKMFIDEVFECYTLEDEHRDVKVMHETRIPSGTYEIKLRLFGGHHERYKQKFNYHKGMLWLQDVPNFKDILIHIGNTDEDTSGCILVGQSMSLTNGTLSNSTLAYSKLYQKVSNELSKGNKVFITVNDEK